MRLAGLRYGIDAPSPPAEHHRDRSPD
jgi:hypothetical protein